MVKRPAPGTQDCALLELLEAAHGAEVSLPEILALGIAQYTPRIYYLRHKFGANIPEPRERWVKGVRHTWYRLLPGIFPGFKFPPAPKPATLVTEKKAQQPALFAETERHMDLG